MRVLVACEYSGIVRDAFSERGHDAWSCDILPTERRGNHFQGDVLPLLRRRWDLVIAHPPCTYLSSSGALWWDYPGRRELQRDAIAFFIACYEANAPYVCVENPVGIMSSILRKPDQYVQPWQFGHTEQKRTGLWLRGLPKLEPTRIMQKPSCGYWSNQTPSGQNKLSPSKHRAKDRSRTYTGIARAMAAQWG